MYIFSCLSYVAGKWLELLRQSISALPGKGLKTLPHFKYFRGKHGLCLAGNLLPAIYGLSGSAVDS